MSTRFQGSQEHQHGSSSTTKADGFIATLKDKSVDELRKLSSNKDAYQQFLHSLEEVKIQNHVSGDTQNSDSLLLKILNQLMLMSPHTTTKVNDELCKENLQLADENLRKEPRIVELRNQYKIISTTELAAAQEKLNELYRQKEEIIKLNSPLYLLKRIQEAMNKTDEESENLHHQFLDREIDLGAFLQKYKKLRTAYHRKSLINLAAKTSNI